MRTETQLKKRNKMIFVDDEIVLKEITEASAKTIFDSINRSRNHLRPWLPFVDQTRSAKHTRNFIISVLNNKCIKKDKVFEIYHDDEFAGLIALKEIDYTNLKVEIGYWLDHLKTGKGIILRSCKKLIDHAFNDLKLNRVSIKIAIGNEKSTAIPIALNFYQEGVERDGELINNKHHDLLIFSMLKKDWKS